MAKLKISNRRVARLRKYWGDFFDFSKDAKVRKKWGALEDQYKSQQNKRREWENEIKKIQAYEAEQLQARAVNKQSGRQISETDICFR